jgi:hypothetical protein
MGQLSFVRERNSVRLEKLQEANSRKRMTYLRDKGEVSGFGSSSSLECLLKILKGLKDDLLLVA